MVAYQEYALLDAQQVTQHFWTAASCFLKHDIFIKYFVPHFTGLDAHVNFCANEEEMFVKWPCYFLCQVEIVASESGVCYDEERIVRF